MSEKLYKLISESGTVEEGSLVHQIELNKEHSIFKGHFPDQPVLPGVSQIGIITDFLEQSLKLELNLINAKNVKFLKMIDPGKTATLSIETSILENSQDLIKISSQIKSNEGTCLKFKAVYKPLN